MRCAVQLRDKAIVITGGATGIGRATALYCGQLGARLVVGDLDEQEGRMTVEQIEEAGATAHFFRVEISREEEVARLMTFAEETLGRIDVLINSAGILLGSLTAVDEVDEAMWDSVIDVNLKGSFLAVKHVVPAMKRAGGGVVLLIASGAGVRGASSSIAYGSSKGGVHGMAMTLEPKLAPDNIRIHAVCPGSINTPLKVGVIQQQVSRIGQAARPEEQIANLGDPEGVAKVLAFLASDDADYVRGTIFTR